MGSIWCRPTTLSTRWFALNWQTSPYNPPSPFYGSLRADQQVSHTTSATTVQNTHSPSAYLQNLCAIWVARLLRSANLQRKGILMIYVSGSVFSPRWTIVAMCWSSKNQLLDALVCLGCFAVSVASVIIVYVICWSWMVAVSLEGNSIAILCFLRFPNFPIVGVLIFDRQISAFFLYGTCTWELLVFCS